MAEGSSQPSVQVFEALSEGVQILGPDLRYVWINESAAHHLGCQRDRLVGRVVLEAFPGLVGTEFADALRRCLRDHTPHRAEVDCLVPGGPPGSYLVRAEAVPEGVAVFSRALAVAIDERPRDSRSKASRSLAEYESLFGNSVDAVLLTSPDGRILKANPAACALFGRTEAELRATPRDQLVDTGDPRLVARLQERASSGKTSGRVRLVRSDGSRLEAELSSAVFDTDEGPRTSLIIRDVTEHAQAEARLAESEERYRKVLEQAPVGIAVLVDGRVVFPTASSSRPTRPSFACSATREMR